ncbi:dihydroorotate oxidase [Weissella diestrammenae]|uniref:dihydroorotate oxidase (fumarate) n=1 Tax=Weissella diestrammenae TaxID=1162633 RepID=A0A7G9T5C8_9LACO|nr:dihydroorotate oxidase [Weissella diestrammenae]MCM0583162.1 dihydroorotate oxidase [Weissella diestrammenae]QNN75303.1 dihydroorotate oxidase [Weissella diestrammenae]
MANLSVNFGNFTFNKVLLNASGVLCQDANDLDLLLANTHTGSLVTKSSTPTAREGNPLPRYFALSDQMGTINSSGLPNHGFQYYLDYVLANQFQTDKPLFFSIAGIAKQDNLDMLHKIQASDYIGLTELNLSCPNVPGKPQMAYDFHATATLLAEIFTFFTKPLGVKLPPYFDLAHFDEIANILNQYPLHFVNTINSIGNGLVIDPETDTVVIKPKEGFGGIGGKLVKATALANVRALRQRLKPEINIIGTGGVTTGRDVYDHILCGADLVAIGSTLSVEGISAFERIENELEQVMTDKGYETLDQCRNQLNIIE